MNAILILAFLAAGIIVAVGLTVLALVVAGIRREERDMNFFARPRTRAEILARRVLGIYIRQPGAFRAFAARVANIPDEAADHTTPWWSSTPRP